MLLPAISPNVASGGSLITVCLLAAPAYTITRLIYEGTSRYDVNYTI